MIYINKEIEDKRAWSDGFILDDIQFENSILDFKISTEGGYIICPIDVSSKYRKFKAEEKIYIPKIICSLPIRNQYGSRIIYLSK